MNENEAGRIAAAMHELRPDWPTASIKTLILKRLGEKPRRDVAVALAWVACESNSAKPARVCEPGPWWHAAAVEQLGTANHPPHRDEICPSHPAYRASNCGGCAADALAAVYADDEPAPIPPRSWPAGDAHAGAAAVRAAMGGAV